MGWDQEGLKCGEGKVRLVRVHFFVASTSMACCNMCSSFRFLLPIMSLVRLKAQRYVIAVYSLGFVALASTGRVGSTEESVSAFSDAVGNKNCFSLHPTVQCTVYTLLIYFSLLINKLHCDLIFFFTLTQICTASLLIIINVYFANYTVQSI